MRVVVRRLCGSSEVNLNIRIEDCCWARWHSKDVKHLQFFARLSPLQLKKLEAHCGSQPNQWVVYCNGLSYYGMRDEVQMKLAAYACQNNGREEWALVWGRKDV